MIHLLVLLDGTMVKVSSDLKVGTVSSDVSGEGIYGVEISHTMSVALIALIIS